MVCLAFSVPRTPSDEHFWRDCEWTHVPLKGVLLTPHSPTATQE